MRKNPNSASVPTWDEYGKDKNYIQLDLNITAEKDLFPDRMKLILEDIPRLISQPPIPQSPINNASQHSLVLPLSEKFKKLTEVKSANFTLCKVFLW
ncbi:hypothetical protein KUTeg_012698 [Tegillarca granosa]|uniref:Uncharacterized protein n=1 Tax=Tegillarca granosa TaxID=220873 RepID=A0ABQ9F0F0_TEGGR|nr:hypothetical protein KUTeg_012698 [Tegillarca granosa]